ncbi:MAG: proline dehydrogenase family protein, partial [Pseudomonadota bacterium]
MLKAISRSLGRSGEPPQERATPRLLSEFDQYHQMPAERVVRQLLERLLLSDGDRAQIRARMVALEAAGQVPSPIQAALVAIAGSEHADAIEDAAARARQASVLARISNKVGAQLYVQSLGAEGSSRIALAVQQQLSGARLPATARTLLKSLRYAETDFEAAQRFAKSGEIERAHLTLQLADGPARALEEADANVEAVAVAIRTVGRTRAVAGARDAGQAHRDAVFNAPAVVVSAGALIPNLASASPADLEGAAAGPLAELMGQADARGVLLILYCSDAAGLAATVALYEAAIKRRPQDTPVRLGLTIPADDKRAIPLVRRLRALAQDRSSRLPVRLTEGGTADAALAMARKRDWPESPGLPTKAARAISYLAAARTILDSGTALHGIFVCTTPLQQAAVEVFAGTRTFDLAYANEAPPSDAIVSPARPRLEAIVGAQEEVLANLSAAIDDALQADVRGGEVLDLIAQSDQGVADLSAVCQPKRRQSAPDGRGDAVPLTSPGHRGSLVDAINGCPAPPRAAAPQTEDASDAAKPGDDTPPVAGAVAVTAPFDPHLTVGEVLPATAADVADAVARARAAQAVWGRTPTEERVAHLAGLAGVMLRDRAHLLAALIRETGLTLEAAQVEWRAARHRLAHLLAIARETGGADQLVKLDPRTSGTWSLRPRGVFGALMPASQPLVAFVDQAIAPLLTGNAVVIAPAEQSALSVDAMARLVEECGVAADLLPRVFGGGDAGQMLAVSAGLDGLALTGRRATAERVRKARHGAGLPAIPILTDIEGLNAVVVDPTADADAIAADLITRLVDGAGLTCHRPHHVLVHEAIADELKAALVIRLG